MNLLYVCVHVVKEAYGSDTQRPLCDSWLCMCVYVCVCVCVCVCVADGLAEQTFCCDRHMFVLLSLCVYYSSYI